VIENVAALRWRGGGLDIVLHTAIRKVIYTTNAIESINFQLRKIIENRGHFPDDDAAMTLLHHGVRNITGRHIDGTGLDLQRGETRHRHLRLGTRPQRPRRPLRRPAPRLTTTTRRGTRASQ
jgi:hypothetical protein